MFSLIAHFRQLCHQKLRQCSAYCLSWKRRLKPEMNKRYWVQITTKDEEELYIQNCSNLWRSHIYGSRHSLVPVWVKTAVTQQWKTQKHFEGTVSIIKDLVTAAASMSLMRQSHNHLILSVLVRRKDNLNHDSYNKHDFYAPQNNIKRKIKPCPRTRWNIEKICLDHKFMMAEVSSRRQS